MASRKRSTKTQTKVGKVMHEYKHGELHSGSKKGPKVKNQKQAVAIALSEARRAGGSVPAKKGKKTATKKTATKKSASKKTAKKTGAKKSSSKKTTKKAASKSTRKASKKS